jgi:hypothetical protein
MRQVASKLDLQGGGVMSSRRRGAAEWIRASWPYVVLLLIAVLLSWILATLIASPVDHV